MKYRPAVGRLFILTCSILIGFPTAARAQRLANEAGFMSLEPVSFYFHFGSYFKRLPLTSSKARIFYSFQSADRDGPETPVFVFFNGGPGSATSCGLMSMGTGRTTLDNRVESGGGTSYIDNPWSWTRLGHLLYVDARQTGFSYNLTESVQDEGQRFREFNAQNFNSFFDAADFIRVLLRFLAAHPSLQSRPVVIVGESYGGVRATAMLYLLLNYADFKNGRETFQDPALVDEIQAHWDAVFPSYAGQIVPPEVITRQFGHQVLIQPALSFNYQEEEENELLRRPDSPLYRLGEEVGVPYDPQRYPDPLAYVEDAAKRDLYIYAKPVGWLNGFFNNAAIQLRFVRNLSQVTGVDVTTVPEFYASTRAAAYRVIVTSYPVSAEIPGLSTATRALFVTPAVREAPDVRTEPGDMESAFGSLRAWDRYFIGTNFNANYAFHIFNVALVRGYDIQSWLPRYGRMFLKNTAYVPTFITNAALDLVVYAAALPPALARHTEILESVEHVRAGGEARPGRIVLTYRPSAFADIAGLTMRTIRFPIYDKSCHAVSLTQPQELMMDVTNWLRENGLSGLRERERRPS